MSSTAMQTMPVEILPQDADSTDHRWLRIKDAVCAWRDEAPPEGDDVLFIEDNDYEDYKDAIGDLLGLEQIDFIHGRANTELGRLRFRCRDEDTLSQLPPIVHSILERLSLEYARRDLEKFIPDYGYNSHFRDGGHKYELYGDKSISDVSLYVDACPAVIFDVQTSNTKELHYRVSVWLLRESIAVVVCVDIHEIDGMSSYPPPSTKNITILSMPEFKASATQAADGHLEWSVENVTTRWAGDFNILVTVYYRDFGDFDQTGVARIRTSEQLDLTTDEGIVKFNAILAEQSNRLRERLNLNPLFSLSVDKRGLKSMIAGLHMDAAYERYSTWACWNSIGVDPLPVRDPLYVGM